MIPALRITLYISAILALLSLTALLFRAQWLLEDARLVLVDVRGAAKNIGAASATWNNYSDGLAAQLATKQNEKAINAGVQLAAKLSGTVSLINTQVVPRTMRLLDAAEMGTASLNTLVANTDRRLTADDGLLPESTRLLASVRTTADAFQVDGKQLSAELVKIARQGQVSMDNINAVLASDRWLQILKHVEGSTANIEKTTAELPSVAKSVEKIAQTSAKFSKAILVAQLLATIAGALIP